jgi:energy-converting hydrogenase Eha subunit C
MNGITVTMAIVDFIPVGLFFAAALILQRDLYNKMVKGAFALLATGSIMVLISGVYKALWKILYACNLCDFTALDISFFPIQAPGFLFAFLSLAALLTRKKSAAPVLGVGLVPVYASNLVFIVCQTLGCAGFQWCLFFLARRMKKRLAAALFAVSFVFMMAMGYLSAKFDDSTGMHWLAQSINIVGNGALLYGVWSLHRAGLAAEDALRKETAIAQ